VSEAACSSEKLDGHALIHASPCITTATLGIAGSSTSGSVALGVLSYQPGTQVTIDDVACVPTVSAERQPAACAAGVGVGVRLRSDLRCEATVGGVGMVRLACHVIPPLGVASSMAAVGAEHVVLSESPEG
jgi:hypothetical protein